MTGTLHHKTSITEKTSNPQKTNISQNIAITETVAMTEKATIVKSAKPLSPSPLPRVMPKQVSASEVDTLNRILGAETTNKLFTTFDPAHRGPYSRTVDGFYTEPIKSHQDQKAVHQVLDAIYPRSNEKSNPDRMWRSINNESDQMWIGRPGTIPRANRAKHMNSWLESRDEKAMTKQQREEAHLKAKKLRAGLIASARRPIGNIRDSSTSVPPKQAVAWGNFTDKAGDEARFRRSAAGYAEVKKAKEEAHAAPKPPPAAFKENFTQTAKKTPETAPEEIKKRETKFIPPHERKRIQDEKKAAGGL